MSIVDWVKERTFPWPCTKQWKCLMVLLIIPTQRSRGAGQSQCLDTTEVVNTFGKYKLFWGEEWRPCQGMREKNWLCFQTSPKSWGQSWGGGWKSSAFHVTCARTSVPGCPPHSFLLSSLPSHATFVFPQTPVLMKPSLGLEKALNSSHCTCR